MRVLVCMGEEVLDIYRDDEEVKYKHTTIAGERLIITSSRLIIGKNDGDDVISFKLSSIESITQTKQQHNNQTNGVFGVFFGVFSVLCGLFTGFTQIGPVEFQIGALVIGGVMMLVGLLELLGQSNSYKIQLTASDSAATLQVSRENLSSVITGIESRWH